MIDPGHSQTVDVLAALRETEHRLRESELRLRLALWAADMICWEWDVPAGQVRVTGSLGTLANRDDRATGHLAPSQLSDIYPDDRPAVVDADRRSADEGADYAVEFRVRLDDGSLRWVAQLGRVVDVDPAGRPRRIAGVVMDVTERRHLQQELGHRANHDPLTDLPNRSLFVDRLGAALHLGRTNGRPLAVLFLDLDGFKAVNDRFGHDAGDHVLITVADRLRAAAPAEATIARLGGDEFTVLLEGTHEREAEAMAATIAEALRQPIWLDGEALHVAASIGVATADDDLTGPAGLLRSADAALYRAKGDASR